MLTRLICTLLLGGIGLWCPLRAQISVTTHLSLNPEITVCGDSIPLDIEVFNGSTTTMSNMDLNIVLPPGLNFLNLQSNHDFGASIGTGPANLIHFQRPSLAPSESAWARFYIHACCPIATLLGDGSILNPVQVQAWLDFQQGGNLLQASDLSGSINVKFPEMSIIQARTENGPVSLGDVLWDTLVIRNGGLGSLDGFSIDLALEDERTYLSAFATSSATPVIPLTVTANPQNDSIRFGITDPSSFQPNEELRLYIQTQVVGCGTNSSRYEARWGCCGDTCDPGNVNATAFLNVGLPAGNPQLIPRVRALGNAGYGCSDDTTTVELWYKNEGATIAYLDQLDLASEILLGVWFNEFQLNGLSVPASMLDTFAGPPSPAQVHLYNVRNYTLRFDSLGFDFDGAGGLQDLDGDGFFDDLAPGDSTRLTFQMNFECLATSLTDYTTWTCGDRWRSWYLLHRAKYQNQCGDDLGSINYTGKWAYFAEQANLNSIAPTDFEDGDTAEIAMRYSRPGTWWDAVGSLLKCPQGKVQLEMDLPPGYSVSGDIEWRGQPYSYQQQGQTVICDFPFGPQYPFHTNVLQSAWTYFDLNYDCQAPGAQTGLDTLRWRLIFDCDTTCTDCERCLGASEALLYSHCNGACAGVRTLSLDIDRLNFGWTDISKTAKATAQTPGVNLDRAYVCDTVAWRSQAVVETAVPYSNILARFHYKASGDPYQFVGGWLYRNNDSCAILPHHVTKSVPFPGEVQYDISTPTNCLSVIPGDSLKIKALFRVTKFGVGGYVQPDPFRATFVAVDSLGQELTCDNYGERFAMMHPREAVLQRNFPLTCDTLDINLPFNAYSDGLNFNWVDFPAEYRELYQLQNPIDFILPESIGYVPGSAYVEASYYQSGGQQIWWLEDTLIPGLIGDTLRLSGLNSLGFDAAQRNFIWDAVNPSLGFEVFPEDCGALEASPPDTIQGKIAFHLYTHSNDPACIDTVSLAPRFVLLPQKPHLVLNPNAAIQDGLKQETEWIIDLCNIPPANQSGGLAPFVWLGLEPSNPAIQINLVELLDSQQVLPLNSYPNSDGVWVGLEHIRDNECRQIRVVASYGQCSPDSLARIRVRQGWECAGWPADPSQANCEGAGTELFLRYRNADFQMEVTAADSLPVDLCDTLEYHVRLKSTGFGYMYGVKLDLDIPPGMAVDWSRVTYQYPLGGTPQSLGPPDLSGNLVRWHLDSLIFFDANLQADTGLVGVTDTMRNEVQVKLPFSFTCDFQPGAQVNTLASGTTNCGDSIRIDPYVSPPLLPQGFPDSNADRVKLKIVDGLSCGNGGEIVDVRVINASPDPWTLLPTLSIQLSAPFQWSNGFNGIHHAPNPNSFQWNASGRFSWTLPVIPSGDSVWFQFEIEANGWLCGDFEWAAELTHQFPLTCPDTSCVISGSMARGVWRDSLCCCRGIANSRRPDAEIGISNVTCVGDSLEITLEICNQGDTMMPAGVPIMFYAEDPLQFSQPHPVVSTPMLTSQPLFPQDCISPTYTIPNHNETVHMVINDDGQLDFPLDLSKKFARNQIGECHFGNNHATATANCICDTLPNPIRFQVVQNGPDVTVRDSSQGPGLLHISADLGDGSIQTGLPGAIFQHTYTQTGPHEICVLGESFVTNNTCCKDTACQTIQLDTCAFHQAAIFANQLSPLSQFQVEFINLSYPGSVTSVWDFGDGTTAIGGGFGMSHLHTYAQPGKYQVTLISTGKLDGSCCLDTTTLRINVVPKLLYPVPAQAFVTVTYPDFDAEWVTLQLVDGMGRVLVERRVRPIGEEVLELGGLPKGIYRVRIVGGQVAYGEAFLKE